MNDKHQKIPGLALIAIHFKNELKSIFTDSGALLILVIAMIIYPIIYSVGYMNETMTDLPIGVVDMDKSAQSREYIGLIDASSELNVTYQPFSLKEAEDLMMKNKIGGVVLIPDNFERDIEVGEQAHVAVYADASYFLNYKNAYMAVIQANTHFNEKISVQQYLAEGKSFRDAKAQSNPLDIQPHLLYNPASAYGSFVMPGLILVVIQQTLLIGIGLLGGSFSESKKSPFLLPLSKRRKEILPYLLGKSGAYLFISLLNIALAIVMVHHWFEFPDKANMLHIIMLLFPYLFAVIFLGIGLSTLFRHRESAIVFMVFLSPIALFFSGLSWPVSAMPQWLVTISKALPSSTVVSAYLRLRSMGVGLLDVKHELFYLYIQAGLYALMVYIYFLVRIRYKRRKGTKNAIIPSAI